MPLCLVTPTTRSWQRSGRQRRRKATRGSRLRSLSCSGCGRRRAGFKQLGLGAGGMACMWRLGGTRWQPCMQQLLVAGRRGTQAAAEGGKAGSLVRWQQQAVLASMQQLRPQAGCGLKRAAVARRAAWPSCRVCGASLPEAGSLERCGRQDRRLSFHATAAAAGRRAAAATAAAFRPP